MLFTEKEKRIAELLMALNEREQAEREREAQKNDSLITDRTRYKARLDQQIRERNAHRYQGQMAPGGSNVMSYHERGMNRGMLAMVT